MLEVWTGSICCWGEGHSCWFEFGTKIVPSSGSTSPLQELDYSWEFGKGPQLHQGTKCSLMVKTAWWHWLVLGNENFWLYNLSCQLFICCTFYTVLEISS